MHICNKIDVWTFGPGRACRTLALTIEMKPESEWERDWEKKTESQRVKSLLISAAIFHFIGFLLSALSPMYVVVCVCVCIATLLFSIFSRMLFFSVWYWVSQHHFVSRTPAHTWLISMFYIHIYIFFSFCFVCLFLIRGILIKIDREAFFRIGFVTRARHTHIRKCGGGVTIPYQIDSVSSFSRSLTLNK